MLPVSLRYTNVRRRIHHIILVSRFLRVLVEVLFRGRRLFRFERDRDFRESLSGI